MNAHPFLDQAFEIKWTTLGAESVAPDVREAMTQAGDALEALRKGEGRGGYEGVFTAFEDAVELLSSPWSKVNHLEEVCDSPTLREAYNSVLPEVSAFFAKISLDDALWKSVRAASQGADIAALDPVRRRHVEETVKDFLDSGAELPPEKKERLAAVQSELSALTQKYSENVLDSTNAFELIVTDPARLSGLPAHAREAARQSARKKGHGSDEAPAWLFSLQFPSFGPVMQYADDDTLRRELYEAFAAVGKKAPHDNTELIWKILALRHEKALLLGKANFADVTTARRMAKSGRAALDFVEDMHARVEKAFAKECRELEEFKAETLKKSVEPLEPWESAYWMEKLRKVRYDFDEEALRPYFPLSGVLEGMFRLFGGLYGIRIEERTGEKKPEVWHPDVRFFDVYYAADGAWIGSFYSDWYPRASKRSGAWMDSLRTGRAKVGGPHEPHLGLICGNVTEPQADKPALLTHREAETVFHEFGHLLHHILGDVPVRSLSGTSVAWDFVELPSQIAENWTWERTSLDLFARHWQTGATIPQTIFDKMVAARRFGAARASMRQLSFGKLDLELHLNYEKYRGRDLDEVTAEIQQGYLAPTKSPIPSNVRSFSHLFSSSTGYAAGYYSYKWAEVLEADAFTRFLKEGVLNAATGADFRAKVLSKGNSRPAEELFRDFMGRDPDPEALLVREGIVKK
jgi:oligopeptidase A